MSGSEQAEARPGLWRLLQAFGTIGLTSLGGGRFAYFYHEFVQKRHWLEDGDMLDALALSQVLPGPNIGNLSVLLGQRLRGLPGSVLALLAVLTPGALAMLVLSALYFGHGQVPALLPVFRGIGAAAAGLALATSLQVAWSGVRSARAALLATSSLIAIAFLHLSTVFTILLLGGLGTLLFRSWRPLRSSGPERPSQP